MTCNFLHYILDSLSYFTQQGTPGASSIDQSWNFTFDFLLFTLLLKFYLVLVTLYLPYCTYPSVLADLDFFRQHAASIYGSVRFVSQFVKKNRVSVRLVTLWVRPPPVKICVSVRWVTLWVRPPPVKICVSVRWITLCVRPPPVCPFNW